MYNVGDRESGRDTDSVNMLLIGANEVWFCVVSHKARQRTQFDPDIGSGPETRSHGADHGRVGIYLKLLKLHSLSMIMIPYRPHSGR